MLVSGRVFPSNPRQDLFPVSHLKQAAFVDLQAATRDQGGWTYQTTTGHPAGADKETTVGTGTKAQIAWKNPNGQ